MISFSFDIYNHCFIYILGDNIQTAICVARECGILNKNEMLSTLSTTTANGLSEPRLILTPSQTDISKFVSTVIVIGHLFSNLIIIIYFK